MISEQRTGDKQLSKQKEFTESQTTEGKKEQIAKIILAEHLISNKADFTCFRNHFPRIAYAVDTTLTRHFGHDGLLPYLYKMH